MKKRLLLLTVSYPFGLTESFVGRELPYVAAKFDEVIILPMIGGGEPRAVPANVRVEQPVRKGSKGRFYLSCLLDPRFWWLFLSEFPKQVALEGFSLPLVTNIVMQACNRMGLERHSLVRHAATHPDDQVVYAYWGTPMGLVVPALARKGVSCCVRYHGFDLYRWRGCQPWQHEVVNSANLVVFASEHGRKYLEQDGSFSPGTIARFHVCRLGVPDMGTNPPAQNGDRLVMVSCSQISDLKRVHLIARVAKALAKSRPVAWHHFGGDRWDSPELILNQDLKLELSEKPEALDVHLHGMVPLSEIMEFYRNNHVDLFVHLSTTEACTVAVQEAISFGIPAVVTDVGGLPEVVSEGRAGILVGCEDANDGEALAARILKEMEVGGAIQRSNPRQVWAEGFNADNNFERFAQLLLQMWNDGPGKAKS